MLFTGTQPAKCDTFHSTNVRRPNMDLIKGYSLLILVFVLSAPMPFSDTNDMQISLTIPQVPVSRCAPSRAFAPCFSSAGAVPCFAS